jgi:hypothetical protein
MLPLTGRADCCSRCRVQEDDSAASSYNEEHLNLAPWKNRAPPENWKSSLGCSWSLSLLLVFTDSVQWGSWYFTMPTTDFPRNPVALDSFLSLADL